MDLINCYVNFLWVLLVLIAGTSTSSEGFRDPRIINGTEAVAENTLHQVSVRMKSRELFFGIGHVCGGSLITQTIVLSAAHCFYNEEENVFNSARGYFVVMGTLNRFEKTNNTLSYEITHYVQAGFDRPTFRNDVSVLFLDGTVPVGHPTVKPIALSRAVIATGTVCQVTGWGDTELGYSSDILMTVDVPIIDRATCSINYLNSTIVDGMICAGYMEGEKDACQGDSGGPLACDGTLVGVVSFGSGCAEPGFPGVYADVRYYADWIDKTTKSGASSPLISGVITALALILIHNL